MGHGFSVGGEHEIIVTEGAAITHVERTLSSPILTYIRARFHDAMLPLRVVASDVTLR